jgi:hypothetical protein
MAELKFTYQFKLKLAKGLENYLWDNRINLEVKPEYRIKAGDEETMIDIAILNPKDENRIIGIELEVISGTEQILVNYNKLRKWVQASPLRKGALFHVFTSNAKIYQREIYELLEKSYDDTRKDPGFFYEFFYLSADDFRKYSGISRTFIEEDWDFDARLFALIGLVFGKGYLN